MPTNLPEENTVVREKLFREGLNLETEINVYTCEYMAF